MTATVQVGTNLNERVYETLKTRLVRRELGPGEKVSLHELATSLGVSRSPVHHALTRLVAEGLLTVKSRRGYYVSPLTEATIAEGYDVRLALELQAAECAVGKVGRAGLRRFRELHDAAADAVSHAEWDTANAGFHEHQVDRAGKLEGGSNLPTEHEAIVAAYEAGDLVAAHTAIRTHIGTGRRIALEAIEASGGVL